MENKKKLSGAEILGIKVIVDPDMECSDQILFPEKLAKAKETIKKIKNWPPGFEGCGEMDPDE
ncbi:hypothetical protein [Pseudobacter ginsenosidimutans]|uniref:Uncharacterized protein n=1 Tax=Pseudobacter ginsenosidimutans TaxID=661488 RepID=A0A4V2F0N7_9BACT|nr:hypothetical protein [Pseudobacter ginsenosidimutans]QEC42378.1 hypothetical protein FSB84_12005 [Pseudobacter ginsenosidimutans]RZS70771.1 hypothetical protein EV199_2666 [Pseudobacter ginsenosidimutans]